MKQYRVLKEMINAPVGTILSNEISNNYLCDGNIGIVETHSIGYAIDQGFIESYTPEPKHWRAEKGARFWFVSEIGGVYSFADKDDENEYYDLGNCFKSQATAELVAKAQKLFFELLHDTEITYMKYIKLEKSIKEARKACEKDDSNE